MSELDEPLLRCQPIPDPPPKRRAPAPPPVCLHCWQRIIPLSGHDSLTGGFGHRPDCPERGIEPGAGDLAGRWVYGEPGWDTPVILCEGCGVAAASQVGDDENVVLRRADEIEEWEWVQWLYENPAQACWDCGQPLPTLTVKE